MQHAAFCFIFLNRLLVFCLLCMRTYYCLEPGLASAPQFSSSIRLKVWHKFPMVQISFLSPERQHQRTERNTKDWSKSLARPYSFFTHHWKPNKQDTAPFLSALMPVPWNTTKHPCKKTKHPHVLFSILALEICRSVKVPENNNANMHIS